MEHAYTTPEYVHLAILKDAARIANEKYAQEFDVNNDPGWRKGRFRPDTRQARVYGDIFRADPVQSRKGGLCLSVDPRTMAMLDPDQQMQLREIGRSAIKQSIVENQRAFVGLILGEARKGDNYFDRYEQPSQTRLS